MNKFSHINKQNQPKMLNVGGKLKLFILFCIISKVFYGQNTLEAIVVDSKTLIPIEFVDVYSNTDYTSTNADGRFLITSKRDSLSFRRLGYYNIKTSFQKLFLLDTIKLIKKEYELDEIVIKNNASILEEVFSELKKNYPYESYKEKFSLRSVLRKDGEIVKIQDLYGKLERKSLFGIKKVKKNYTVELLNMRKSGMEEKKYNVLLFSFNQFLTELTSLGIKPKVFTLKKSSHKDDSYFKIDFSLKKEIDSIKYSGYYIVNQQDNGIVEFYSKRISKEVDFIDKRGGALRYRTIFYERFITFKKSEKRKKYYVDKVKINASLELLTKDLVIPIIYDYSYIMSTEDNFGNFEVKKNVSTSKDMFRLKYRYDESFWLKQNQLLLTREMQAFLDGLENSQYKVKTNMTK